MGATIMLVLVLLVGLLDVDRVTTVIGTRAAASDNKDLETYSEQSPLGAALIGAHEGETREYTAPNGKSQLPVPLSRSSRAA